MYVLLFYFHAYFISFINVFFYCAGILLNNEVVKTFYDDCIPTQNLQ